MPPLSLDPVSEQVASNSQALESLVATVARFEQQLTSLSTSFIPTATNSIPNAQGCGSLGGTNNSYAKVASSTPPIPTSGNSYSSGAIVRQKSSPGHYLHHDGRDSNLVLFGLPESGSIVDDKAIVDEAFEFL